MAPLTAWGVLADWPPARWVVAVGAALATYLVVAIPTDLVDTPVFGRSVPPTWWAAPTLAVSSVLAGLLVATYVRAPKQPHRESVRRGGIAGAALAYLAVGCPVCIKIVLLALGSTGAMSWFAPVQPLLQAAAIGLLVWALHARLRGEVACRGRPETRRGGRPHVVRS